MGLIPETVSDGRLNQNLAIMKTELKKVIITFIFDHEKEYQLNNATTNKFRPYIYTSEGNYLIGGEEVSNFIGDAIKLIKSN